MCVACKRCIKPALWLSSVQRKESDLRLSVEEPAEVPERAGEPEAGGEHAGRPHQKLRPAAVWHDWRHRKLTISFHIRLPFQSEPPRVCSATGIKPEALSRPGSVKFWLIFPLCLSNQDVLDRHSWKRWHCFGYQETLWHSRHSRLETSRWT